jgi:hypothetical protein
MFNYFLNYADEKLVVYDAIITTLDKENPSSDKKFFNTINQFDNLIVGFLPRFSKWNDENTGKIFDEKLKAKYSINITDKSNKTKAHFR